MIRTDMRDERAIEAGSRPHPPRAVGGVLDFVGHRVEIEGDRTMRFTTVRKVALSVVVVALASAGGIAVASAGDQPRRNPPQANGGTPDSSAFRAAVAGGQSEIYTGIKPCRILDTRATAPLIDASRSFRVSGNLASQGGASNCGIPSYATSVAVNLTGIAVGGGGFIRGWAFGDTPATATLLNVAPAINASNQVNIPLCRGASCTSAFTLRAFGQADIVGDAVGYFTQPLYVSITEGGSIYNSISSGVLSTERVAAGTYVVTFVRPVSSCDAQASDAIFGSLRDISIDQTTGGANALTVSVLDFDGNARDSSLNVLVTC